MIALVSVMKELRAEDAAEDNNLSTAIRRGGNRVSCVLE